MGTGWEKQKVLVGVPRDAAKREVVAGGPEGSRQADISAMSGLGTVTTALYVILMEGVS
jgi:hypothetical protein